MGRYRERTEILLPHFSRTLSRWGLKKRAARELLGIKLPEADFYRVLRSEDATLEEVRTVSKAIYEYGKRYNLPGWEKLEHG